MTQSNRNQVDLSPSRRMRKRARHLEAAAGAIRAMPVLKPTASALGPRPAPARRNVWRLSKTLSRRVDFRPLANEDEKYAWAAYRQGAFSAMGAPFKGLPMSASEFRAAFAKYAALYDTVWTLFAETTGHGFVPVAMVFASWAPGRAYMVVVGTIYMPWASPRNALEAMVNFFRRVANVCPLIGYALPEHKRIYEVCCMHGVMRRIGTSQIVFPGQSAAVFETRAEQ